VADNFGRNKADAPDVCIAILLAETQSLGELGTHDIAVKQCCPPPVLQQ
jgi:hypothetical protein